MPIAEDKTIWPCTSVVYLGYQLNTKTFEIQMPYEKQQQILCLIEETSRHKRITLKQMQFLTGSLAFCAKAMPLARAFLRRMYAECMPLCLQSTNHTTAFACLTLLKRTSICGKSS